MAGSVGKQCVDALYILWAQADNLAIVVHPNIKVPTLPVGEGSQLCSEAVHIADVALELILAVFAASEHLVQFGGGDGEGSGQNSAE